MMVDNKMNAKEQPKTTSSLDNENTFFMTFPPFHLEFLKSIFVHSHGLLEITSVHELFDPFGGPQGRRNPTGEENH
jgi:hypothetical protein